MTMEINNVKIEAVKGDIANQPDIQAVVNAANAELRIGGGVAGCIHRAAGTGLESECRKYAPINPGEAVITGAHELPNDYVIHCLGPVYGVDEPSDKLLAACYKNSIKLAEEYKLESIAFPAISTGAFRFPIEPATDIALAEIKDQCQNTSHLKLIRFVLFSQKDLDIYQRKLKER
ncbi:MAG: macro domain-containing protein [Candidatus Delongbacteria bacterium]|jgi:O-acetyl-ADP-ribose deacetylase (regulator of RNase III)|nr:macro domain-containing protein [Candidatus Delongbacteria bacterium]